MEVTVENGVRERLAKKGVTALTVTVMGGRGRGCGACSCLETVFDYGPPAGDRERYQEVPLDGFRLYLPANLAGRTDRLTLSLDGWPFKRIVLRGLGPRCSSA